MTTAVNATTMPLIVLFIAALPFVCLRYTRLLSAWTDRWQLKRSAAAAGQPAAPTTPADRSTKGGRP